MLKVSLARISRSNIVQQVLAARHGSAKGRFSGMRRQPEKGDQVVRHTIPCRLPKVSFPEITSQRKVSLLPMRPKNDPNFVARLRDCTNDMTSADTPPNMSLLLICNTNANIAYKLTLSLRDS